MHQTIVDQINAMDQREMARQWRDAPGGCIYFREPYNAIFKARFAALGGMTPQISKMIGWE